MVTGSRTSGSSAIRIDEKTRKMIHSIKEIVGNHSEADIFAALKETDMDADEAVQKLIYQDTFHEVKRKRNKKKEEDAIIVEPAERRKSSENSSREVNSRSHEAEHNVRRGMYNQNHFPTNAAPRNAFPKNPATGPRREFRVVRDNRSNPNANKELKHTSPHSSESNINVEVAIPNKKGSSGGSGDRHLYGAHISNATADSRSRQTRNVHVRHSTRKELAEGTQAVLEVTVPSSNSLLGVYSSSADPVHVPSPDSRSSAVGAIRREVRGGDFGGKPSEHVIKDSAAAGSLVGSSTRKDGDPKAYRPSAVGAIRREVRGGDFGGKPSEHVVKDSAAAGSLVGSSTRKDGASKTYRPFSPISNIDQGSQTNTRESLMPNRRSLSNSQQGNRSYKYVRTHQQAGGISKGVSQNKQWKPKSNQKSIRNNPGVIGNPKKPRAPPADNSINLESEIVKFQDKIPHVSISESQNVIIADHIRVPETDRCQLTFGSFVLEFDPSMNSASGFEEACSSLELQHSDIDDRLPSPPPKASTNGASGTETIGTFDSEVRTSGDVSPPPVFMAPEQQLSEDSEQNEEAPRSLNSDEYAQTELRSGNSPYTAVEPKQQQDHLELHNFSDYDPRGGYDLPYFRQAMDESMRGQGLPSPQEQELNQHIFNNAPASTIPMLQQQQAPMAQMYPQVHVSHFPNGMPYRQFLSPVYVPQMPMQGYSGNPAAYAHPSNGNSYVLMPGGSSHPGANGLKYGIQPFKQVPAGGPAGLGTFNNPNGYQITSLNVVGNAPVFEDSSRMKYKDGNAYVPNPQAETSEIWMQNPRDLSGLQSSPYYNMAGQTPHGAYLSSFNPSSVQSSHMQFQGVFQSPQPGPMANPHHMGLGMGGNTGLGVAPSPSPVQVGAYQQPQLGHLNWPANF